jgi:hypothetical protein
MERIVRQVELDQAKPCQSVTVWAKELGASDESIVRLSGGINNYVYRVDARCQSYVLKHYPPLELNARDRMKAEVEFLQYAREVAAQFVPQVIDVNSERRVVTLEYIRGKTFPDGALLTHTQIREAVYFFNAINKEQDKARSKISMDAADGFLNLSEHLLNVDKRLSMLTTSHLPKGLINRSTSLINRINTEYNLIKEQLVVAINRGKVRDSIERKDLCISPSDFGFHNAIQTEKGVKFFDFEFAGWDDPAKASIDFVLQPRVRVLKSCFTLIDVIQAKKSKRDYVRIMYLAAILRLKWICIISSVVLDPERFSRLTIKHAIDNSLRYQYKQINTAWNYLHEKPLFS